MEKIAFDKKEHLYELLRYTTDENGFCQCLCPYGQELTEEEYSEAKLLAMVNGCKVPNKTYLIGSVMCVQKCKYMVDEMEGTKAILCGYRAEHPDVERLPRMEDFDDLNDYLKAISRCNSRSV